MPDQSGPAKHVVSRRCLLKGVPVLAGAAVSASTMVRNALAQQKLSHDNAKYQDQPKNGQQCSTCTLFEPPSSCKIVVSPISPKGWCQFYAVKST